MPVVPLSEDSPYDSDSQPDTPTPEPSYKPSSWVRVPIQPGVELHFEHTQIKLDDDAIALILENIPKRLKARD